jgi:hypothetical protein
MDEVSHSVKRRVKLFTCHCTSRLLHFFTTLHFRPLFQFMTLRRLNLKIQGFPESYATEPYAGENMVVGEPHQSPSMSPQHMSRGGMPLSGGDPNLRPQPEAHDSSMGIRGSPPTPTSASPLRNPPNMPNGLSPRGSPPHVRPESSPRGSPSSIHSGAGPRGSPARSVHSAASNRRSPPPMQGIPIQTMTSPRGSPPPMQGIPMQAMASPRGSPSQMHNGASPLGGPLPMPMHNGSSPRGSPQPMSPPPMHNRSSPLHRSPNGSPRGSPSLTHDASTGDGLLQQADSVTKV